MELQLGPIATVMMVDAKNPTSLHLRRNFLHGRLWTFLSDGCPVPMFILVEVFTSMIPMI
jgi:hypothetical protein